MEMFANPEQNIAHLSFRPNMRVADFGAGAGAYSLAIAKQIAPDDGKVFAIEVQKEVLDRIKNDAEHFGLTNLEVVWADVEAVRGTKLADDGIDIVILSNVLFQAENKPALVAEVKRVLKPGGQVLLIDWIDSFGGLGPQHGMLVSEASARQLFETAGFSVKESFSAGAHHYGMILIKK